ncbi:hypothetical protein INT46_005880 [Mucor plumbeus]|uniref:Uncharacterized protein n=1 Tax=Mucor plumbeus TaxID=97098 RepID=A0A8H7R6U8_9FUNG|nr:hypothetical protein INT46_005880 [Mucor plumbeus]
MNFPPPIIKLNDLISGTVVTMDEWIKNEIYRLQNNIKPRHFENYSELAEMIHEDPGRFQHRHHHLPPPPLNEDYIHSSSSSDEEEEKEEEEYGDVNDDDDDDDDGDDNDDDEQDTEQQQQNQDETKAEQQNTQLNPLQPAPPPSWLCRVFIELIRYSDRITIKDNAPKLLIYEFEKLKMDIKLGKSVHVDEFREKLLKILFGEIQMTEHLVQVWKLMCEWVTKPPLHTHQNATRWIDLTLSAYIAAQRLFIVGNEK